MSLVYLGSIYAVSVTIAVHVPKSRRPDRLVLRQRRKVPPAHAQGVYLFMGPNHPKDVIGSHHGISVDSLLVQRI